MRCVLTPRARFGLFTIVDYVQREFGDRVAEDVLARLERAFDTITTHPGVGSPRPDLTADEGIRFWTVGPTLIAYRSTPDTIEILFIERGERDWIRLLRS